MTFQHRDFFKKERASREHIKEAARPFTNDPGRCAASPPLKGGEWGLFRDGPIPLLSKEGKAAPSIKRPLP
jgi:hypothetical protein